jgi:hypothetical protein
LVSSIAATALVMMAGVFDVAASDPDDDPWSMFGGSSSDALFLLALIPLAVLVIWYGGKQFRRERGGSALRPKGRTFVDAGDPAPRAGRHRQRWRNTIERLEARAPTPVAEASRGPVRLIARIVDASGNLGGPAGRECVWRNRAGGNPRSAVGAELVIVADETGRCGVENVESARVIAPSEQHTMHHESVSLRIGDQIELFGLFDPETVGEDPDSTKLVYGTLGSTGELEVRLLDRPVPEPTPIDANASSEESS